MMFNTVIALFFLPHQNALLPPLQPAIDPLHSIDTHPSVVRSRTTLVNTWRMIRPVVDSYSGFGFARVKQQRGHIVGKVRYPERVVRWM